MSNFSKAMVTMLALTTVTLAAGFLAAPATAQGPRPTVTSGSPSTPMFITTSAIIAVEVGQTFKTDGVEVPSCLKGTTFLATAVQAVPYVALLGGNVINLPKWSVSLNVFQVTPNGSFSPQLTVIGDGPAHASTSIPGGQPLYTDEDNNVVVRLLGASATVNTPFAVHVTGYCGTPFVTSL